MNNTRRKKCIISIISVLFLVTVISVPGTAQVPKKINYQGYLIYSEVYVEEEKRGLPVDEGTYQMAFTIYDVPTEGSGCN